ncbi:MAG: hypothetical protein MUE50_01920 [Pirellulaceae bacterium]|nr:hypothetical protein [Pirellulaceae bacterium]
MGFGSSLAAKGRGPVADDILRLGDQIVTREVEVIVVATTHHNQLFHFLPHKIGLCLQEVIDIIEKSHADNRHRFVRLFGEHFAIHLKCSGSGFTRKVMRKRGHRPQVFGSIGRCKISFANTHGNPASAIPRVDGVNGGSPARMHFIESDAKDFNFTLIRQGMQSNLGSAASP